MQGDEFKRKPCSWMETRTLPRKEGSLEREDRPILIRNTIGTSQTDEDSCNRKNGGDRLPHLNPTAPAFVPSTRPDSVEDLNSSSCKKRIPSVHYNMLTCLICKKQRKQNKFNPIERKKGVAGDDATCKSCAVTNDQELFNPKQTEAWHDRQNNSITLKDRLIQFCELNCILAWGGPCSDWDSYSHPFEYWGLPPNGMKDVATKSFRNKIWSHFLEKDMKYLVKRAELVEQHLQEVAGMARNQDGMEDWMKAIVRVRMALAKAGGCQDWMTMIALRHGLVVQGTKPNDTEAYNSRYVYGTITPKDRLIELCELKSIAHGGEIDSEFILYPPRRTTNRYWGISPLGGLATADMEAWKYFVELEMEWVSTHSYVVHQYYDEVVRLGYDIDIDALLRHGNQADEAEDSDSFSRDSDDVEILSSDINALTLNENSPGQE